jgi:hypothetical protein
MRLIKARFWAPVSTVGLISLLAVSAGCVGSDPGMEEGPDAQTPVGGEADAGMGTSPDADVLSAVRVRVASNTRFGAPLASILVSINRADGSVLASGQTDSEGLFVSPQVPSSQLQGGSITAAGVSYQNLNSLQTVFGIQAGREYRLVFRQEASNLGRISVTASGQPNGQSVEVNAGVNCRGNISSRSATLIDIQPNCLETPTELSAFAIARNGQDAVAYSLATELVAPGAGGTIQHAFTSWRTDWTQSEFHFVGAPSRMTSARSELLLKRNNASYIAETVSPGEFRNSGLRSSFKYPFGLVDASAGNGYGVRFSGNLDGDTLGTRALGFTKVSPLLVSPMTYTVGNEVISPDLHEVTLRLDSQDSGKLRFSWTLPSFNTNKTPDAVASIMVWRAAIGPVAWYSANALEAGQTALPTLPDEMADYRPSQAPDFSGPIVTLVDQANHPGYGHFVENQGMDEWFTYILEYPNHAASSVSWALTTASEIEIDSASGVKKKSAKAYNASEGNAKLRSLIQVIGN